MATIVFDLALVLWSIVLPIYRSADEFNHVGAALYWAEYEDWPDYNQLFRMNAVEVSIGHSTLQTDDTPPLKRPSLTKAAAEDRPTQLPFDDLARGVGGPGTENMASQHPPGYYIALGTVHDVAHELPWDREVWLFRFLSLLLLLPLPLVAAAAARALGASRHAVIAAALVVPAIPQVAAIGGAVNNDNLLNAASAWLCLGLVMVLKGDLRVKTAAWLGIASAVALFTKGWAVPVSGVLFLAYVVAARRAPTRTPAVKATVVFAGLSMLGGWWWIRNLILYHVPQPAGHIALRDTPLSLGATISRVGRHFVEVFPERFWAMLSIKYGYTAFPAWLPLLLSIALVALLVIGAVAAPRLQVSRRHVFYLLAPVVLTFCALIAGVLFLARRTGVAAGLQGRYLYATLVLIAVVAALGMVALARQQRRIVIPLAGFVVVAMATAFGRAISYHYGEARWSNPLAALPDVVAWSPLPPALTWALLVAMVGAWAWLIVEAVRETRRAAASAAT